MSFERGFNMGGALYQQRVNNERQAKLDARQAVLDKRADDEYTRTEKAFSDYDANTPVAPVRGDPGQYAQPTDFQATPAGLAPAPQGYRPQASAVYDQITGQQPPPPPGYRPQAGTSPSNMPSSAAGGAPMEATGLPPPQRDYVREKSQYDRALNNRNRNLALGLRDRAGLAAADAQEDVLNRQDIANDVARLSKDELGKFGAGANNSGIPVIYLGKNKNGYMVQMTDADGEPGKKFTLNESEMRQFAMASKLAEAGYGTDAMVYLSAAHKELGAHIGTWNSMQNDAAKISNDAQYKADSVAIARDGERAKAGYYRSQTPAGISDEANEKITRLEAELDDPKTTPERRRAITTSINSALAKEQRAGRGGRIGFMPYEPNQPGGANAGKPSPAELRYQLGNIWQDTAKGMRIAGQGEDLIAQAREGFFAEQGFAPAAAINDLLSERDPKTGERRTREDLDSFNRMFPNSAMDPAQIPWLRTEVKLKPSVIRMDSRPLGVGARTISQLGNSPGRAEEENAAVRAGLPNRHTATGLVVVER
jgi:hypothetical protein